jgi:hypothetical protein
MADEITEVKPPASKTTNVVTNGAAPTPETAPVEKEPDAGSKLKTFVGILRR